MEGGTTVTYPVAFLAGLVSFITPCVLPLVPVYLSILSGTSFNQMTGKGDALSPKEMREIHKRVIMNAVAFIIGFTLVFVMAGVLAGSIGDFLKNLQFKYGSSLTNWMLVIFGILMLMFGLNMSGIYKPRFLNTEARFQLSKGKFGLISSGIVGAAFAFGWTPCIGPILAPILALAAESGSKTQGALLLLTYSAGLAIPFFLSALSVNGLLAFSQKMRKHFRTTEIILGSLLLIIGLALAILGGYGLATRQDGLTPVRRALDFLNEPTSRIEESIMGQEKITEDLALPADNPDLVSEDISKSVVEEEPVSNESIVETDVFGTSPDENESEEIKETDSGRDDGMPDDVGGDDHGQ